jgi:NosR/NirI family transcriptional regulator, nitrous oxide reductase regulator
MTRPTVRTGPWSDLARVRAIRWTLRRRWLQFAAVAPMLALVAIALVSAAVGLEHPAVNFGTVATWGAWWGVLLVSIVLVGRAWCLVCPIGALGEWVQRLSLWWPSAITPGFGVRWPRWLAGAWLPSAIFTGFVFLDNGYGMSNSPRLTAGLIAVMALAAVWIGVVFERRAFCRYLCPLTVPIGLGALVSVLEVRRRDGDVCARCRTKDCYAGNAGAWGCPMGEYPGGAMDTNERCILCAECVRACAHDNVTVRVRPPGRDLWAMRRARLDGAASAITIAALTMVVPWLALIWLPPLRVMLSRVLPAGEPPNDPPRLIAIVILFVIGIALTFSMVWATARLARWTAGAGPTATRTLFVRAAYALVPIAFARMLADVVDHTLRTWGALGHVTRALILDFPWNRAIPGQLAVGHAAPPLAVYAVQVLLLLGGMALALLVARRMADGLGLARDAAEAALVPIGGLAVLLTLAGVFTLGLGLV